MNILPVVSLGIALGLSSLMLAQSTALYLEIIATSQPDADRMTASIRADGYTAKQVVTNNAQIHLRVGPYKSSADREEARAVLALKGIKSVSAQADDIQRQQTASLPAMSFGAGQKDAEAAALAKLGLSQAKTAPKSQVDLEAEALKAMQANTERESAEAEKRRLAGEVAAQQAEADRLQREIDRQEAAANTPPQQSTAASFLNALNGVIAAGTDAYAQQQAANQARLDQIAALRAQQVQIEANKAAEQRKQQQAALAIATPSATGHPQTESSAICDDARDHLPPGSTRSAYQGCIPYKGTQTSQVVSNTTNAPSKQIVSASSAAMPQAVLPIQAPTAKPKPIATASCRNMLYSVELTSKWTDAKKTEVVGFFDNNSIGTANCVWAFHKNGQWTDYGSMNIASGKRHVGGEFGGVWSTGTDSFDIKYACYEGPDAVDAEGLSCIAQTKFLGPTKAGTDKY